MLVIVTIIITRVVVYYTQPSVGHNETFDYKKQSAGTLSNIILLTLKQWNQRLVY